MKGPAPPPQLQLAQLAREHGVPGCRVQGCSLVEGLQPGCRGCSAPLGELHARQQVALTHDHVEPHVGLAVEEEQELAVRACLRLGLGSGSGLGLGLEG